MLSSYDFVRELINNEKIYSKKLKDRVKVNEIFNEIDISVNNNLKKFIQMSESRYKNIKSGIAINDFLIKQKGAYEELSNKILANNLYKTNDIENEVQKLHKKVGTKERKELYKIRKYIINNSKDFTQSEINLRKQYENKINKSKKKNKNELTAKEKEIRDLKNFLKKEKNLSLDDKKKYLNNILEKDSNFFDKNFQSYKDFLKDIEKHDSSKIIKIMNKNDNLGHNYTFNIKNIKLLSFQKDAGEKFVKKKEEEKFDFKKLSQYTRHGNKKWFQKELKEKSIKRKNSINNYLKNKMPELGHNLSQKNSKVYTKIDFNKTIKSDINKDYNNIISNTLYNSQNSTGFNKTIFSDFRNTIKTVKSEAEFIRNISQNFDVKRKTMNKFFKSSSLPNMEDYEKLTIYDKNKEKESNKESLILTKLEENNDDKLFEFKFIKDRGSYDNSNDIMDVYKTIFNDKVQGWTKEHKKKKQKKEKDNIRRNNNQKFIDELSKLKRKPNLFADIYSKRDGIINEKIKLLNNSLSIPIYSKKIRLNIINDFNNYIQNKEKERIQNEEMNMKKQMEEDQIIQGQDEHYQLMKKMVKNLNLENKVNEEEDNINFDYRYSSSIHNNKKDNKNKSKEAFNEYLFFYDYLKNKKNKVKDNK